MEETHDWDEFLRKLNSREPLAKQPISRGYTVHYYPARVVLVDHDGVEIDEWEFPDGLSVRDMAILSIDVVMRSREDEAGKKTG